MNNVNLITTGSKFEGTVEFKDYARFEGYLTGTLKGRESSYLVIAENGVVEGNIEGDTIVVDGFVRGKILAKKKVIISGTGKVIGEILSPSIGIQFGGYFDGKCEHLASQ